MAAVAMATAVTRRGVVGLLVGAGVLTGCGADRGGTADPAVAHIESKDYL